MISSGGIGLALSGGGVRGIAHIGVLEILEREGIPISAVAGTSAGSIVGALYAAGMPLSEIRRLALETAWKKIIRPTLPAKGLLDSEGVYRFMSDVLPVTDFSSLPFAAVATDLETGGRINLTTGPIARAVQASCSLPIVFTPTQVSGRTLVDGGVASMVPVRTAREVLGAKRVIAVDVNTGEPRGAEGRYESLLKIAVQVTHLLTTRNAREEEDLADLVIPVSANRIALYDLTKTDELLRRGREAAERSLKEIRRLISPKNKKVDEESPGSGPLL